MNLSNLFPVASPVKSVQRGSAMINGSASVVVTISPVDLNKAVLILSDQANVTSDNARARGQITSPTTLTFTRGITNAGIVTNVEWQVIEFV